MSNRSRFFTTVGVIIFQTFMYRSLSFALKFTNNKSYGHSRAAAAFTTTTTTTTSFLLKSVGVSARNNNNNNNNIYRSNNLSPRSYNFADTRKFSTMPSQYEFTNGTQIDISSSSLKYPIEMTEDERYLFDLNGYLIVRNVLTKEEVRMANEAIDKRQDQMVQRDENALRNAVKGTAFYGSGPGRKDLGGVLEWDGGDSKVLKSILAHPRLVPLFHGILGKGYRMDHLPFIIASDKGGEGFQLHGGTVDCASGEYNHHLAYTCHHGTIRSALLGCSVVLSDHDAGNGGFVIVPGSHKSNFKMPSGMVDGERYQEYVVQPQTKAGDVILFSEGTVHGAKAWTADYERRICLYRFAPSTNGYGRSYFSADSEGGVSNGGKMGWPEKMYDGLNEAQKAVLEPPYANRLDRPNIEDDGSVSLTTRNERKKQHDKDVFGTKYF